jgi:hypothetical protein
MMAEVPLEAHDLRQLRLWRRIIYDLYDKYGEVFEEYGYGNELRDALNNLDSLLNTLSTKLPYELKVTKTREFLRELDRFRVFSSRYLKTIAEQLYRDVKEIIDGIFSFSEDVEDV